MADPNLTPSEFARRLAQAAFDPGEPALIYDPDTKSYKPIGVFEQSADGFISVRVQDFTGDIVGKLIYHDLPLAPIPDNDHKGDSPRDE